MIHRVEQVVLIAHENSAFYTERLRISPLQLETQQREDIGKAVRRVRTLSRTLRVSAFFARTYRHSRVRFEAVNF